MRIRQEQFAHLQAQRELDFIHSSAWFYRTRFPNVFAKLDDRALAQRVAGALASARSLGIRSSAGTTQYVALALFAGPTFTSNPIIRAFLTQPGYSPDSRIHELLARSAEKLRAALSPVDANPR